MLAQHANSALRLQQEQAILALIASNLFQLKHTGIYIFVTTVNLALRLQQEQAILALIAAKDFLKKDPGTDMLANLVQ